MSDSSPEVTVLYFAGASTATGTSSERVRLSSPGPQPLSSLSSLLLSLHPGAGLEHVLRTCQWSVDAEMVEDPDSVLLKGGEEVAVIPPVSGG
ncbi:hypothetical protein GLOTRDRAFT_44429 [Gloeophyllum trabeum ATCC 11539]|uniref:MOCS2A n=1 Tax=Gloeophyllum trabeum (strain ATCC 11539 / FP-39264 / Madison 617) TaxID=670483 RepID=S7Q202_GLOTA|nr:uncharacterized protein GLOTRDRAFT_44429 [Gloeophyllum trabeum ATCC 11539]EPQ54051.1 hypothetical protein GLOTRDRAFT_44429 [Gloeophyllum trabeum ATCC 11539]